MEPTVDEMSGREETITTVVTLPLVKKEPDVSQESQEKSQKKSQETKADEIANRREAVYELIRTTPGITTPAIAKALAITDRKVRTVLEQLKQSGRIRFEGTGRGGRWMINE